MDCPRCAAPLPPPDVQGAFTCAYCGGWYFPEPNPDGVRILGEEQAERCPLCKVRLVSARVGGGPGSVHLKGGIPAQHCPECQGLLLPMPVFGDVIRILKADKTTPDREPPPLDRSTLERSINCPRCGKPMSTHPYGGPGNVVVDNCLGCGVLWLDYRELSRIRDTPERRREPPPAADKKDKERGRRKWRLF